MTKRRYPQHRKPPVSHSVSGHTRGGHSVGSYVRGSGSKYPNSPSRSSPQSNAEAFVVTMRYRDGTSEKVNVIAPRGAYKKAIDEALEERTHKAKPIEINILDPSLGEVIGFIRRGVGTGLKYVKSGIVKASPHVKSGVRKGAKGLKRGVKSVGRGLSRSVESIRKNREAQRLVNHSYSEDPGKRALARTKLKEKYPEVYDNCDFSRRTTQSIIKARQKRASKPSALSKLLTGDKKKRKARKKKKKKKKKKSTKKRTITITV